MIWTEQKEYLIDDEKTRKLIEKTGNFDDSDTPEEYLKIWEDVSKEVQLDKARRHGLSNKKRIECFSKLCKRPYYLTSVAKKFGVKNIVEVGTAEGLQFFSFAEYSSKNGGHVWSCDIKDVRNKEYTLKYKDVTTFCLGDSKSLSQQLSEKIDLFYIDGAHDYGSVVRDVVNLREHQSENPIWIFDDFDKRFGCYKDIQRLCMKTKKFKIYRVGNAASGNPNHQVIIFGKI